ncbi:MAG: hypothetical protein UY69_C0019G0016 [Parcubacteria group bacterium GW2011_GWF1_52_5]|nr:MAG: hypothetical protein UY69_C0019G0016 [Parcubacteria group bacterium GW2011_GWF1_52_5]
MDVRGAARGGMLEDNGYNLGYRRILHKSNFGIFCIFLDNFSFLGLCVLYLGIQFAERFGHFALEPLIALQHHVKIRLADAEDAVRHAAC